MEKIDLRHQLFEQGRKEKSYRGIEERTSPGGEREGNPNPSERGCLCAGSYRARQRPRGSFGPSKEKWQWEKGPIPSSRKGTWKEWRKRRGYSGGLGRREFGRRGDDRGREAWCWSGRPSIAKGDAAECQGKDAGRRIIQRERPWRRGFEWWSKCRSYQLCSGREAFGSRGQPGPPESHSLSFDSGRGFKRRYFEKFEEEEEEHRYNLLAAGSGREAGGTEEEKEQRGKKRQEAGKETIGPSRRKEEEEEGKKEKRKEENEEGAWLPFKRWKLWRGVEFVLREQRRSLESIRQRDVLRASSPTQSPGISGVGSGDVGPVSPRTAGQGSFDGDGRWRSGNRCEDHYLFCTPHPTLLSGWKPFAARVVRSGTSHRPPSFRQVSRNWRRAGFEVRSCSYGPQRGVMGHRKSARAVPSGKHSKRKYGYDVASSAAQEVGTEESRLWCRKVARKRQRQLAVSRREGQQRRWQGKRKRQERRTEGKRPMEQQPRDKPVERKPMEGSRQGGGSQEVRCDSVEENKGSAGGKGLAFSDEQTRKGLWFLTRLLPWCSSLALTGGALAWLVFSRPRLEEMDGITDALRWVVGGNEGCRFAMHRGRGLRHRSLIPFPLGSFTYVYEVARGCTMEAFTERCRDQSFAIGAWTALCLVAVNGIAGHGRRWISKEPTVGQKRATTAMEASVKRMLLNDVEIARTYSEVEKEMSSRFLSYTGEEVPKMQTLSVSQVLPALPPESHGGSIDARDFVSPSTKFFLENPNHSLLGEKVDDLRLLQAKVHIQKGDELELCKLLVSRNICGWIPESEVLTVQGRKVLNGLFGVGKGKFLDASNEKEVVRVIMNLKPTNRVMRHAEGSVSGLPSITQYLSLVLEGNENAVLFQSDMSSAFYLFRIPPQWMPYLCFGISFSRDILGIGKGREKLYLACNVIPMGWASAVSVMQEIADRLAALAKLPEESKVRRLSPLPVWMVQVLGLVRDQDRAWYHVYLDNFCAMSKRTSGDSEEGFLFHKSLEDAWDASGVLSSSSKRVSGAAVGQELGGYFDGSQGLLGPSGERLVRLIQCSLMVIGNPRLRKKWVQVVAGRWVHVMSFRRPGMIMLDKTWRFISSGSSGRDIELDVRGEIFQCCITCLMLHTNLRATISETTTASDASSTGGAVGASKVLSLSGSEFSKMDAEFSSMVVKAPILVISLFNGVGCAFRCYDLIGVQPLVGFSYEINQAANRITSRRWPFVEIRGDVRDLTEDEIRTWRFLYPLIEEIHLWAGFPCVDLSKVKFNRRNLQGEQSGLFYEILRILKIVRRVYGFDFCIKYFLENVASMDREAERQISVALGAKPYRVDSADFVPLHRPRFCWSNVPREDIPGITLEEKEHWTEISMTHEYPLHEQWIEEGWAPMYEEDQVVYPTCMKSIVRRSPPPCPAGLGRCDLDTRQRWEADCFRFPPYQYKEKFLFWKGNQWRLMSASERELLHGMGFDHTSLCLNANDIKRDPVYFEDLRKSLLGDSFNCISFAYFAALACHRYIPMVSFEMIWNRAGLAPGFVSPLFCEASLERRLKYGGEIQPQKVSSLHRALLRRVNHTGSDVRVSTGAVTNPRAFPRQSAPAAWWLWEKVFAYKWQSNDHINSLELRALVHAIEWRTTHLQEVSLRAFYLTDSYVAMSVVSKGRSSSKMLKPLLRRLAAVLLAFDLYLVVSHVESSENPTDAASRS